MKRFLCVHLHDDFSGSTKIMAQTISVFRRRGYDIRTLIGSHGATGFIRESHPVTFFKYRFGGSTLRMLVSFGAAQFRLFFTTWKFCQTWKPNVVYVNTLLPAGAIIAAVFSRIPVVVHLHEVNLGTPPLFHLLIRVVRWGANRVICVSNFVAENISIQTEKIVVVPNALSPKDRATANLIAAQMLKYGPNLPFTVLMACSLKWYKGIDSFVEVARRLSQTEIRFRLILNCELQDFNIFTSISDFPCNLEFVRRPASVYDHYRTAGLVVNLSHKEGWLETFGLTLLEGMACAIPVIAPQIGGCTELVQDGEGGWLIDSNDINELCSRIAELASNSQAWAMASASAHSSAMRFSDEQFSDDIHKAIQCFL